MRNMVFISHANPQDNEFSLWLALRLAREGYPVWCDLTRLLGGETFWRDIEVAIRERSVKFIYVLSRTSNKLKDGPLDELNLAIGLERREDIGDFVIPMRIDDLAYSDIQIQINRKNVIDSQSWSSGLTQLLEKFEADDIPQDDRFNPAAISHWWREAVAGEELIVASPEVHLSNLFSLEGIPHSIYTHTLKSGAVIDPSEYKYPVFYIDGKFLSFASAEDLGDAILCTEESDLQYALARYSKGLPLNPLQYKNAVMRLVRLSWENMVDARGLPTYDLAHERKVCFFRDDMYEESRVSFSLPNGFRGSRKLAGSNSTLNVRTQQKGRRYWHFGLSSNVRLWPQPMICINSHVLFSDDGKTIWESKKRLHSARRSHCKNWWNDVWRDRLLAAVSLVAKGAPDIKLQIASNCFLRMACDPVEFNSSVTYEDSFTRYIDPETPYINDDELSIKVVLSETKEEPVA